MKNSVNSPKQVKKNSEIAQIARFGLVGILNTVVDFVVLNVLVITILPKSLEILNFSIFGKSYVITGVVLAGIISGTAAMINSFIFNRSFTFKTRNLSRNKIVLFFVITAFGLYVIRPVILYYFTQVWLWPSQLLYEITASLKLPFSQDFDTRNLALLVAIVIILVYNYLCYKYLIFRDEERKK